MTRRQKKKSWHTQETCWKLHGKPLNQNKKACSDGKAFSMIIEESQGHQIILEILPFTND